MAECFVPRLNLLKALNQEGLWHCSLRVNTNPANVYLLNVKLAHRNNTSPTSLSSSSIGLNPLDMTGLFIYPWKHWQTRGFLMFSGGIDRDHLASNGLKRY